MCIRDRHRTEAADVADARVALLPAEHPPTDAVPDLRRALDQALLLDHVEEEGLVERSAEIGDRIRRQMLGWQERHARIGDVRGLGSMLAIELVRDPATKEPAPELVARVIEEALSRGLLLLKAGVYGNCIRVLVPLVIDDAQLDEALLVWEEAIDAALAE